MNAVTTALRNMRRSPYQALIAVVMLSLVFFFGNVLAVTIVGAQMILRSLESRPQVVAFFATTAPDDQVSQAASTMKTKSYVKSVTVVSKQDALKLYQQDNKKDPLLLELVSADIFPASIEVSANDIESLPKIRDDLTTLPGVDDVVYQKDVIGNLTTIIRNTRIAGLAGISFLFLMSTLFIVAIVSLRLGLKRQEIAIMRLLGAGFGYIMAPYMVEACLYGIIGALVGWTGMFILLLYMTPQLVQFFGSVLHFPISPLFLGGCALGAMLVGMIIGMLASTFAVRRFVREA